MWPISPETRLKATCAMFPQENIPHTDSIHKISSPLNLISPHETLVYIMFLWKNELEIVQQMEANLQNHTLQNNRVFWIIVIHMSINKHNKSTTPRGSELVFWIEYLREKWETLALQSNEYIFHSEIPALKWWKWPAIQKMLYLHPSELYPAWNTISQHGSCSVAKDVLNARIGWVFLEIERLGVWNLSPPCYVVFYDFIRNRRETRKSSVTLKAVCNLLLSSNFL